MYAVKHQVQIQNRLAKPAQHRVQRTVCHAPFKGVFPLEKYFPFCGLVRVANRREHQPLGAYVANTI